MRMENFIRNVKNYPILWNSSDAFYRDSFRKSKIWNIVAHECGIDSGVGAKNIWKKLRCSHREAMRRRQIDKGLSRWKYEELMEFLLVSPNDNTELVKEDTERDLGPHNSIEIKTEVEITDEETDKLNNTYPDTSFRDKRLLEEDQDRLDSTNMFDSMFDLETKDSLGSLFFSLYQKTKGLPKHLQLRVQREIFTAVNKAEEDALSKDYSAS